ncbi:MAG TPA: M28 family metallopeptidase [Hyphomonadaceae bacterium]|nr:M28 family metallopeptidase [Hyphomonadaceae bacterium]
MKLLTWSAAGLAFLALSSCDAKKAEPAAAAPAAPAAPAGPVGAKLTTSPDITAADLAARDKELADDKYEGRGPGTLTGEAAAQWIADEMKRAGMEPGGPNGSWFQEVGMVAQTVDPDTSSLKITNGKDKTWDLKDGPDAVYITKAQDKKTVSFADTDMVFVGYGVNAPEEKWNDYAGLDAKGKTVVMFVNDPGFITNDPKLFKGKAMTYYGRWTYKFEEASRQHATAALIIHETGPASYGWNVVESSWTGEQDDLVRKDAGADQALLQGWISLDKAREMFAAAGLDIDKMRAAANKRGFKPVVMKGLKASATINQSVEQRKSRNVIGTIKGATHPDEHVLLMAHWDHLGKCTPVNGDGICNGAVDNGTGVSTILDIGEKIAAGPKPQRSVDIMAVTLEESGLLGSAYYADNPVVPLNKIVGGINLDALSPDGQSKDVVVVGYGSSQMEDILKTVLAGQNRTISPDPKPEAGHFYRSDHISLSKKGVPMLYLNSGTDLVKGGKAAGEAFEKAYEEKDYHQPSDQFHADWDWSGIEQDAKAAYEVANQLANSTEWPAWYPGNEFKAIREASLKGK